VPFGKNRDTGISNTFGSVKFEPAKSGERIQKLGRPGNFEKSYPKRLNREDREENIHFFLAVLEVFAVQNKKTNQRLGFPGFLFLTACPIQLWFYQGLVN